MDLKFVTLETFFVQTIILLIVLWVLNKFVFKPYLAYLDDWEEKQKKLEEDYKNIDVIIKTAQTNAEWIVSEAREKGKELIHEAETIAKKKREEIILKAESDARNVIDSGKNEVEKVRIGMVNSLKSMVVGLILKFHTKVLKEERFSQDFIEKSLDGIIK